MTIPYCRSTMAIVPLMTFVAMLFLRLHAIDAEVFGVCYGGQTSQKLPSDEDVVKLYQSNGVKAMRIYRPDNRTFQALQGAGISLVLGVTNDTVPSMGTDPSFAVQWVKTNVVPYASFLRYITVGSEIHPYEQPQASQLVPAMQNVVNALKIFNLDKKIKVSTVFDMLLVENTLIPSEGRFIDESYVKPIINFLNDNGLPLSVDVYPYYVYKFNKHSINIDYALFTAPGTVISDSNNGLEYQNLFDALMDLMYAALAKIGAPNLTIVVSESGWPSAGGEFATVEYAGTYYRNLISYLKRKSGTPLKPGKPIELYLFEMFDEDTKLGELIERYYGLFTYDMRPKYGIGCGTRCVQ